MIKIEHLQKQFDGCTVLRDVNAEIHKGDVVSLIGPSGTGKSTLLRCINMIDGPTGGKIYLDGEEITAEAYPMEEVHRKVCMVFQSFNLFEHLSVIENVMLPQVSVLKKDRQSAYDEGMKLLSSVGMAQKSSAYPASLSGGQKQRVAIARTLAMNPKIILFDEPTSALDPSCVDEVKTVIRNVAKSGVTCLIVTHDMDFSREISNRVFYMDQGEIYEEGTPDEIFEHPERERTQSFVRKEKSLEETITGRDFDYPGFMSKIFEYGFKSNASSALIRQTQLASEELICSLLFSRLRDPFTIHVFYEYDSGKQQMKITAEYDGDKVNILDPEASGADPEDALSRQQTKLSLRLLFSMLEEFGYSYREEKRCPNTIRLSLKKLS